MTKDEHIKHWVEDSDRDFQSAEVMFTSGQFTWALFVGHLSVEKLLKAYYIQEVDLDFPRIHNLRRLAELTALELTNEQKKLMVEVTEFNLNARYTEYRKSFFKKATREFCADYLAKIKEFREWLLQEKMK